MSSPIHALSAATLLTDRPEARAATIELAERAEAARHRGDSERDGDVAQDLSELFSGDGLIIAGRRPMHVASVPAADANGMMKMRAARPQDAGTATAAVIRQPGHAQDFPGIASSQDASAFEAPERRAASARSVAENGHPPAGRSSSHAVSTGQDAGAVHAGVTTTAGPGSAAAVGTRLARPRTVATGTDPLQRASTSTPSTLAPSVSSVPSVLSSQHPGLAVGHQPETPPPVIADADGLMPADAGSGHLAAVLLPEQRVSDGQHPHAGAPDHARASSHLRAAATATRTTEFMTERARDNVASVTVPFTRWGPEHQVTASWAPGQVPGEPGQTVTLRTSSTPVAEAVEAALESFSAHAKADWKIQSADAQDDRHARRGRHRHRHEDDQ